MQSVWLIIVVFFFVLLIVPIFAKVYLSYDILHNVGTISLYVFFIRILTYKLKYIKNQIVVYTNKNKKDIEVKISNKQIRFLKQFSVQIQQKIIVKKVNIISRIGLNDAFYTALCSGLINVVSGMFVGYLKNIKKSAQFVIDTNPNYNGKNFTIAIVAKCFVTIFDVVYAILMSLSIIKRSEKYERS